MNWRCSWLQRVRMLESSGLECLEVAELLLIAMKDVLEDLYGISTGKQPASSTW